MPILNACIKKSLETYWMYHVQLSNMKMLTKVLLISIEYSVYCDTKNS